MQDKVQAKRGDKSELTPDERYLPRRQDTSDCSALAHHSRLGRARKENAGILGGQDMKIGCEFFKFSVSCYIEDIGKRAHEVKAKSEEEARDRIRKAYPGKSVAFIDTIHRTTANGQTT